MTQKEFENGIGHEVSTAEYDKAALIYTTSDLSIEEFCKEWKIAGSLEIVDALYSRCLVSSQDLAKKRAMVDRIQEENNNLQDAYDRLNEYTQNLGEQIDELQADKEALKRALKMALEK